MDSYGDYFDIVEAVSEQSGDITKIPYVIRILIENVLRKSNEKDRETRIKRLINWKQTNGMQISFYPSRIILQDYTGVPSVVDLASMREALYQMNGNPSEINPKIPVDLVIDHSVQVDMAGSPAAMAYNTKKEFERNKERYELLKWAQNSFTNFRVIPPDTGIIHQINVEYLSPVIQKTDTGILHPDSVFGTDSHTTMVNSLGVLGWGVGGIEAEACMLGEPSTFSIPEVIGVRMSGNLSAGVVATDVALCMTELLRKKNVVGKFVEYFGTGYETLSLSDRATIANMAPEYGATCGYFPIDKQTIDYLYLTNRTPENIQMIEEYAKKNRMYYVNEEAESIVYSEIIEFDLSAVSPSLAGPKRPQDRVDLKKVAQSFEQTFSAPIGNHGFGKPIEELTKEFKINETTRIRSGDVLLAAITSCTNTSNPEVLIGAGLLAKNAIESGLSISSHVKTSFAPGSQAVTNYLEASGLLTYLNQLGFHIVAYGCTTCIGNSGPLDDSLENFLSTSEIVTGAVLSGNRNFEGRIHPLIKANYLASPMLVIAYALAGNLRKNLQTEPLGKNQEGEAVFLKDIWPTTEEMKQLTKKYVTSKIYHDTYKQIYSGTKEWNQLKVPESVRFHWDSTSTYVTNPPYFDEQIKKREPISSLTQLRALVVLGDSVTTDHISPAGQIPINSAAGRYLLDAGIQPKNFNSYGAHRGDYHVMTRGTLANPQLNNHLAKGKIGSYTTYFPENQLVSIFEASQKYLKKNIGLVIFAGKDYGMGSSRDWAAKGVKLLGVKVIIAESFERIHRSNLVMMGLVPLQFKNGETFNSLGLLGDEQFHIELPEDFYPKQKIKVSAVNNYGKKIEFTTILRYDTEAELAYYKEGGILNKVLKEKVENQLNATI